MVAKQKQDEVDYDKKNPTPKRKDGNKTRFSQNKKASN